MISNQSQWKVYSHYAYCFITLVLYFFQKFDSKPTWVCIENLRIFITALQNHIINFLRPQKIMTSTCHPPCWVLFITCLNFLGSLLDSFASLITYKQALCFCIVFKPLLFNFFSQTCTSVLKLIYRLCFFFLEPIALTYGYDMNLSL